MNHFITLNELALHELIKDGFVGSVQTENLTVAYTDIKAGVEIPLHQHTEEAVDIIVDGKLEMQIGEATNTLSYGMISIVPSNISHRAKAISDCKVITIFYPKRHM